MFDLWDAEGLSRSRLIYLSIDSARLSRAYLSIGSMTILGRKGLLSKSARDMLAYFAEVMKASARTVLSRTLPSWARFRSRCFRACGVAARRSHSDSAGRCSPWLHRSRRSWPADRWRGRTHARAVPNLLFCDRPCGELVLKQCPHPNPEVPEQMVIRQTLPK